LNSGPIQELLAPFDIFTSVLSDDNYDLMVWANDSANNTRFEVFGFTIDSQPPQIVLNSPPDFSVIPAGTIINLSIIDVNIDFVNYTINGTMNANLTSPYDIDTSSAPDGDHTIEVFAIDLAGNNNQTTFYFTIDSTAPEIILNSPTNKSVILPGTNISLALNEDNLDTLNYSVDSGPDQWLTSPPYNITTDSWSEGGHTVKVNAKDLAGNVKYEIFYFIIDTIAPEIELDTQVTNAIVKAGTLIDLTITDPNIDYVNYTINGVSNTTLGAPYDIDTTGWADGDYTIDIFTFDKVGNFNQSTFSFTIDSTLPSINLVIPTTGSVIVPGTNISLNIDDLNLDSVNLSIDGAANQTFTAPFNISTDAWADGNHSIMIYAKDKAGNENFGSFYFIIDSISPEINLISPANNSLIKPGAVLDFEVIDNNTDIVDYSLDSAPYVTLTDPYNISSDGWDDGLHSVRLQVVDQAEQTTYGYYVFKVDGTVPVIVLNTPNNNSVIKAGTTIDFAITEENPGTITYSLDSGLPQTFTSPFDINTSTWNDGLHSIDILAIDLVGQSISGSFEFTIDTTEPIIKLATPEDNSVIKAGTTISLNITEVNVEIVNYTHDGTTPTNLNEPYNISTTLWSEGDYVLTVSVRDRAGNMAMRSFNFTIDSTNPTITLDAPSSLEFVQGTLIELSISDANLDSATYSLDGIAATALEVPYDISTSEWSEGEHQLVVDAVDKAGNSAKKVYIFTITPIITEELSVNKVMPEPDAANILFEFDIIIEFNISVNTSAVEKSIVINPVVGISEYTWSNDNTKVTLKLASLLKDNTKYTITISTVAKSVTGTALSEAFVWSFTTELDTDNDNIPDPVDDDADGDQLPNAWENKHGLNMLDSSDALGDLDMDGLTNLQEFQYNTDPALLDSDSDGLSDGDEVNLHSTDPLIGDSDNDGVNDGDEIKAGTDPNVKDVTDKKDDKDDDDSADGMLGLGKVGGIDVAVLLIVVIIVILLLLVFMFGRKKSDKEDTTEDEDEEEEDEDVTMDGEAFECPECGSMVEAGSVECQECGADVEFEDEDEEDEYEGDVEDEGELEDEDIPADEEPIEEEDRFEDEQVPADEEVPETEEEDITDESGEESTDDLETEEESEEGELEE
jgi:hypothetical protein